MSVINEVALVESQALRHNLAERTEVLDRVEVLSLLPAGLHVTTAMVATYSTSALRRSSRS